MLFLLEAHGHSASTSSVVLQRSRSLLFFPSRGQPPQTYFAPALFQWIASATVMSAVWELLDCSGKTVKEQFLSATKRKRRSQRSKHKLSDVEIMSLSFRCRRLQQQIKGPVLSYRLSFGMYKGWTVKKVHEKSPDYFASLVQQRPYNMEPYHNKPALKEQLIREGLWDDIVLQSQEASSQSSGGQPEESSDAESESQMSDDSEYSSES